METRVLSGVRTDRRVYTVAEITRDIRILLEENFTGLWIEGEVSNFKFHSSGHMYFSLKDSEAQIQCVMFRADNARLGFSIEEGQKLVCYGRVSVYPVRGQHQLYVERAEPQGIGALQLRFEQLKERLRTEGLFDAARKRGIPFLPGRIGVITSLDGAALRDILHVLKRRFEGVRVVIDPVPVQGAGAAEEIAAAIDRMNEHALADVLIVGRGGGSLEDLWAFNEESVARAIFRSAIPVISAVGHETDVTIADFVADLRAATPSAAAEMVIPEREELVVTVEHLKARATHAILGQIKVLRRELDRYLSARVLSDPMGLFEVTVQRLDELRRMLGTAVRQILAVSKGDLGALCGRLEALGPLATLRRGFSVTTAWPSGRLVTVCSGVRPGDRIRTRLAQGFIVSEVQETGADPAARNT